MDELLDRTLGELNMALCACMGRQGNDPLCPCAMRAAGLVPIQIWTPEKRDELNQAMREIVEREEADMRSNNS